MKAAANDFNMFAAYANNAQVFQVRGDGYARVSNGLNVDAGGLTVSAGGMVRFELGHSCICTHSINVHSTALHTRKQPHRDARALTHTHLLTHPRVFLAEVSRQLAVRHSLVEASV